MTIITRLRVGAIAGGGLIRFGIGEEKMTAGRLAASGPPGLAAWPPGSGGRGLPRRAPRYFPARGWKCDTFSFDADVRVVGLLAVSLGGRTPLVWGPGATSVL